MALKRKKRLTPPDGESRRRVSHHDGALLVTAMVHGADELLSTGFAGLNVEICYGQLVSLIATVSARGE